MFVYGRQTKSRASVDFTLPVWAFGRLPRKSAIKIDVEDAAPFAARRNNSKRFDWYSHQHDKACFVTDAAGVLTVHYRRVPFSLLRCPAPEVVYWLLGFYQAEGSKKAQNEWSVVSSNARILHAVVTALNCVGVSTDRLHLTVLYHKNDTPVAARRAFAAVGPRISAVRERTAHKKWKNSGNRGAVLRVECSVPFYRMTTNALTHISANAFPSRRAARAFALGWLEGDGNISINRSVNKLRLYGTRAEIKTVLSALHYGFNWRRHAGKHVAFTTERSLSAAEAGALAVAGAFRFSMNRARLLYGFERASQGLLVQGRRLTPQTRMAVKTLAPEMRVLRRFAPPEQLGKTGVKCAQYPPSVPVTGT